MARKINLVKFPRQNNAGSQLVNRRSPAPAAALYLMQLRAQSLKISPPHRVRLEISTESGPETPEPVKIVWID
jgi:hypothetical protein